ncbi:MULTISPECIES: DUF349 domain-containing protein [Isoptericola]|uniref:DUF349 domain-containing protein n=1 Tax=Isoptericola sediminis TaxID=2733572 RepID=A0A849KBT3_9MICO|nr:MULTISPECIES: DUF349 domain-containing protein [unclassified Isoptericola]MDO8145061.1 DUF349 domain-containing protein [Isoptericola sp. 178]MDO8148695.1 DUF349 domain-containing protein [Isoptericola sp. b515]MDO8151359.1 DUF349 domain-containing protein [Isoptericola sp. b408]NNU28707.1 DUF349 domain-containing protein [Isoptericola sediminis]
MSESTPGSAGPENVEAAEQAQAETPGAGTERSTNAPSDPAPSDPAPSAPEAPRPSAPKPSAPKPGPPGAGAPKPSALHRPTPRTAPTPTTPAAPVPPVHDAAETAAAAAFGRVDDDGTVHVREGDGERPVGQYPGVPAEEALSLYVRRYLDLVAKVALFETRLDSADLAIREIDQTLAKLAEETTEPAAVGDLDALRKRVEQVRSRAGERRAALEAERVAAKERAVEARTEIVEAAEKIAATDPEKMQWRPAGEELRNLLERWKESQRTGPRIDRPTEESLWKRFSQARTAFDRERRHFFAELEQRNASAKAAKEQIVAEAEALQHSTEWGPTTREYRDLMNRWKAAGRAHRKDDDALWARFRAAQDVFFGARDEANAAIDAEYGENLKVKEALLAEAEALVPVKDVNAAKEALRGIQDRWEEAGKVPRADLSRVEGRLRAVESAIRDAEDDKWRRTNPETQARAEGAAAQLEEAISGMESELADAEAAGDERSADEIRGAIAARKAWLEQIVKAAEDSRG